MNTILRILLGTSDMRRAGADRVWRGLRRGDRRDLFLGVALAAFTWLRSGSDQRELIFRKKLPEGTALVIHHKAKGNPTVEVIKPPRETQTL